MALIKTRTFWVALLAVAAAVVDAFFGPGDVLRPLKDALWNLMSDDKLWVGIVGITGRSALLKMQPKPEPFNGGAP